MAPTGWILATPGKGNDQCCDDNDRDNNNALPSFTTAVLLTNYIDGGSLFHLNFLAIILPDLLRFVQSILAYRVDKYRKTITGFDKTQGMVECQ